MFDWYVDWTKRQQRKAIIEVVGRILAREVPDIEKSTKQAVKDQVVSTKKLVIDILTSLAGSFSGATGREADKTIREKMGTLVKFEE